MSIKNLVAMKVSPEGLRAALAAVPEVGEMHINEVLGGYLVLNVPRLNKDGSVSKRPPIKWQVFAPDHFAMNFKFLAPQEKRAFIPVGLI